MAQEIIDSVKHEPDKQLYLDLLMTIGELHSENGNYDKGKNLLLTARALSDSLNSTKLLAEINMLLGELTQRQGDHKQSLSFYIEASKILEEQNNLVDLVQSYFGISSVFFDSDQLSKSQHYDSLVIHIAEELDNDGIRAELMGHMGVTSMTYGINYYLGLENTPDTLSRLDTLEHYFQKAQKTFLEGLELARETGHEKIELLILNNLVALTLNMDQNDEALELANESEALATSIGDINLIIQSKINIGSAYRRLQNLPLAAKYGEESRALAEEYKLERKVYLANRTLAELYQQMGRDRQANYLFNEVQDYERKIWDTERSKMLAEIDATYQTAQKEKTILSQKNSLLELAAEKSKIEQQRSLTIIVCAGLLLIAFFWFQLNRFRKERNDRVAFAEALTITQENERKRVSQDLHDGIGQSLLLIKKQATTGKVTTEENLQLITNTLDELRSISRDLYPFQLNEFGIDAAFTNMLLKLEKSNGIFVSKSLPEIDGVISDNAKIHVYRTVQEALNNVVKHAQATAVKISGIIDETDIAISIQDNGIGFEHKKGQKELKSLGLRTMKERIVSVGGTVIIESAISGGTHIKLRLPRV